MHIHSRTFWQRATKRALAKRPDVVLYGVRIGYPTAYTLGGHIRGRYAMIIGKVVNQEAIIDLKVAGPGRPARQIKTVIDTGYNGHLTLPGHLVSALELPFAATAVGRWRMAA